MTSVKQNKKAKLRRIFLSVIFLSCFSPYFFCLVSSGIENRTDNNIPQETTDILSNRNDTTNNLPADDSITINNTTNNSPTNASITNNNTTNNSPTNASITNNNKTNNSPKSDQESKAAAQALPLIINNRLLSPHSAPRSTTTLRTPPTIVPMEAMGRTAGNESNMATTRKGMETRKAFLMENELFRRMLDMERNSPIAIHKHYPEEYKLRIVGGRTKKEGRVEIQIHGHWGVICAEKWTMMEARVACNQAGMGLARSSYNYSFFGGTKSPKLAVGIDCDGNEKNLFECYHESWGADTECPLKTSVAGVYCDFVLPDLVPNATLLETSCRLEDKAMFYLSCAMEENCAAPSAFEIKKNDRDWHIKVRRLLRFSSSTWNFGTAAFRPILNKDEWEWHMCHMHYHSMSAFAAYDILDFNGNKVAHGHKASFCLEDNKCMDGIKKKYACQGYGDQGISVGCADIYLHDIDCQWVDITDLRAGEYIFKVNINPELLVGELDFDNNAAVCNLVYTGSAIKISNCKLARG